MRLDPGKLNNNVEKKGSLYKGIMSIIINKDQKRQVLKQKKQDPKDPAFSVFID